MEGASKALVLGGTAGFGLGLPSGVTKTFVGELGHGALSLPADRSVYVLVVSAIDGLAPAMASSNAVTLFSSVDAIVGSVLLGHAEGPMAAEPASKGGGIPLALRPQDVP